MNAQEIYQRVCSCAAISKEVVSCALYVVSVVHGEKRVEVDTVIQVINTFGKGSELSLEIPPELPGGDILTATAHRKVKVQSNSHLPIIRLEVGSPPRFGPLSHGAMLVLEILPGMGRRDTGDSEGSNSLEGKARVAVVAVLPLGVPLGKITIYLSLSVRHRPENGFSLGPQPV